MIRPPAFWQTNGLLARALAPFEGITRITTSRRIARGPHWQAPIPVICCGNASVGGTGKTPICLDIVARLRARGIDAHVLTRGYGGARKNAAARVDPASDDATTVGDEAMLLARSAPTWVGADRAASARAATAAGAMALVMDDGLQNPTLAKTCSLLIIDGGTGFGNGRLLPAGPLREPVATAAARCQAAVIIGADVTGAAASLPKMDILQAALVPDADMRGMAGRRVVAFAGIGRPEKFFASLREAGIALAGQTSFPDHYVYRPADLDRLRRQATDFSVPVVTTWKDYLRLPVSDRYDITPLGVAVAWNDAAAIEQLLVRFASHR